MSITKKTAIGVYSDAALWGVDVSIMVTDGVDVYGEPVSISRTYPDDVRQELASFKKEEDFTSTEQLKSLEERITAHMISAIEELMTLSRRLFPKNAPDYALSDKEEDKTPKSTFKNGFVDVIGLSGQTIYHNPTQKVNITLANANAIADHFGCPVVNRFIQSDLQAGGKGGPLLASFFQAITKDLPKPLVFASLGGIVALTYIGQYGELMSFDAGPGNILLDAWIYKKYGQEMDFDGLLGAKGKIDEHLLTRLMKHPFLEQTPPKAADRNEFNDLLKQVDGSDGADGAATLTAFMTNTLVDAEKFLPEKPVLWILSGGGTLNPTLVLSIKNKLHGTQVETASEFGWDKNTMSSQGYAFLAVRSLFGLPISFPSTTGVLEPVSGGHVHYPNEDR